MIVYLSGSVSGDKDYKEHFGEAQTRMERQGMKVINPAEICEALAPVLSYSDMMKVCMRMVDCADAIYMLKGYEDSNGAKAELAYAKTQGLMIIHEEE